MNVEGHELFSVKKSRLSKKQKYLLVILAAVLIIFMLVVLGADITSSEGPVREY